MKIPVFVSRPTILNKSQEEILHYLTTRLDKLNLEPRTLGQSDYPIDYPLREVFGIAKRCSGGLILGFTQFTFDNGIAKPETDSETELINIRTPTPWNQLEAGILYALNLPLLVFREEGITGGVFDPGATDLFLHTMPTPGNFDMMNAAMDEVFLKWHTRVREQYYNH